MAMTMAMAYFVVSAVINRIVKLCASLIQEEDFPLFSGYKDELEKLSTSLISIQANIKDAEESQYDDETHKEWLSRLTEAAYDAEHVLDTIATEAYEFQQLIGGEFSHINSSSIQNISHRIEEIAQEKQRFDLLVNVESGGSRLRGSLRTDYLGETRFFGREKEKEETVDLLLSENSERFAKNVSVFGINGRGGVGKTTLAHLILNDERVQKCFKSDRIWVSLAQGCSFSGILQGIRGFPSNITCSESQYPGCEMAFKEFLAGKRFLIILDNLSFMNQDDRIRLLQLLDLGRKGSKLLYTSRIPHEIDKETSFILQPLSMENSCLLFKTIAFEDGVLQSDLEEIGEVMVEKCEGSPLSIKVLGSLLRGNNDSEIWERINGSNMWKLDLPALSLSYYNLPSDLKECFISCSLFPKDYVFNKNDLVKIWMAQGLIPLGGEDGAEENGFKYFEELMRRYFFQPFKIGYDDGIRYIMHDVVHEFAQSNSCFPKNRYVLKQIHDEYILGTEELFFQQNASQLKFLRVLDLSSSCIFSLPSSIGECKLLRYLDLSMSSVFGLPDSVSKLYNLQTFKLLGCVWLEELPRDLYKLSKLLHFEMDNKNWRTFNVWPPKLGNLTRLRTLSVYPVGHGIGSGYGIDELKNMKHLTGSLHISCLENAVNAKEANLEGKQKLRRLVFEWSEKIKNPQYEEESSVMVLEDLLPNKNIVEVEIVNYRGSDFPIWMRNGVLQNLVVLTLKNCIRCKIVALDLPSLRKLWIKGLSELEELANLQSPVLNELHIVGCHLIHSFPKIGLPASLQLLRIEKCWRLYEQCQKETGREWPKIAHIPHLQISLTEDTKRYSAVPSLCG